MPNNCIPAATDTVRSLAFGSISGTYAAVGTAFTHACRMVRMINNTDGDMYFSDDGANDKWYVPAGSYVLYDYASNSQTGEGNLAYSLGTIIYVKQSTAPSKGRVAVECTYAKHQ